jgi:hypothetical protein
MNYTNYFLIGLEQLNKKELELVQEYFLAKEPPKLLQANLIVAFNPPKDQLQNFNSF